MVEGARLESVFRGNSNVGSNPTLSAKLFIKFLHHYRIYRIAVWGYKYKRLYWPKRHKPL